MLYLFLTNEDKTFILSDDVKVGNDVKSLNELIINEYIGFSYESLNDKEFVDYPKWISEKKVNNTLKKLFNHKSIGPITGRLSKRNFAAGYDNIYPESHQYPLCNFLRLFE